MKKGWTIIGIIGAVVFGTVIPIVANQIDISTSSESQEEFVPLDPEFLERPKDGTLPKDHSVLDNYRIAGGVLSLTENFRTIQEGNAISEIVLKNDQIIKAERYINKDLAYATYSTTSSFVNSTNQRLYLDDKVLVRNGKMDGENPVYNNDEPYSYSYDYIYDNLGWVPTEMCSYIINEDTIVSSRVIEDSDYPYTMELVLDNDESINHTKREIRYNANAVSYPKYEQVKVTISLDNEWRVLEIKTDDIYDITVKMGINLTVPVNSLLVEKFYYDNCSISSLDSYSYFSSYYESEIDDNIVVEKEKTALDYLLDFGFDVLLNGTTFNVTATYLEEVIEGKVDVQLDIQNMSGNIKGLFTDFFFKYDGNLYLSYLKHNYKFDRNFLEHLLEVFGMNFNDLEIPVTTFSSEESNDSQLNELIEKLQLTKEDNNVTILLPIESDEIKMNVSFNFFEMEQGTIFRNIVVEGTYQDKDFNIKLVTSSKKIEFEEKEYNDLSSATWFVDELVELGEFKGYKFHFDYKLDDYDLDVDLIYKDNKWEVVITSIDLDGNYTSIELFYIEEKFYLNLEEYIIEIEKDDVETLIKYIQDNLASKETNLEAEDSTNELDIYSLLYEVINEVVMLDDEHLSLNLLLSVINENIKDTNVIISRENENLKINFETYGLDLIIQEETTDVRVPNDKNIISKNVLDIINEHYSNIESIINSNNIQLDFNDVYIESDQGVIRVNGDFTKNNNNYELELEFSNQINLKCRIIYLDNKYYLSLGESDYSINIVISDKQMETFINSIDKIFDYILGENDLEISSEKFIADIVDKIMSILNGESLDMTIGELIDNLMKTIDNSYLEVEDRDVIVEVDQTKLNLYKVNDEYYLLIVEGVNYNDAIIDGDVSLKEKETTIILDSTNYLDISKIFEDLGIV